MYEIRNRKIEMRKDYLARRAAIPQDLRAAWDEKICRAVLASATYRFADTILLFYPIRGEVNVLPIMQAALDAGKKVAFPRCHAEDRSMVFHYVTSEADFEEGAFGLREPRETLPAFDPTGMNGKNALCIVPAVLYDRRGYRIGYGGGYYDRFFGKNKPSSIGATLAGVAYGDFVVRSVPHGRFDIAVDVVFSERGIYAGK